MFHTELSDRWNTFFIHFQMAQIGAEVGRVASWKKKGHEKMMLNAMYRAIELLDMTIRDPKNVSSLKEILRVKEVLVDFAIGDNRYRSTADDWEKYFFYFTIAARR